MLHNLRAKYFKKYDIPCKPVAQLWQDVMTLVDQSKYDEVVSLYKVSDYSKRLNILWVLNDLKEYEDFEDFCNEHLDDYVCCLIKGHLLIEVAYRIRGSDTFSNVSQKNIEKMQQFATQSFNTLMLALEINRDDKVVFYVLTGSLLLLNVEMEAIDEFYTEAKLLSDSNFYLNNRILNIKTPKWLGNKESLMGFVIDINKNIDKGDANLSLVAIAHYEYYLYLNMQGKYMKAAGYIMEDKIIGDIKLACRDFISHAKLNDETLYAASVFLYFALEFNNAKMAKALLEFTNLEIDFESKPWMYEDNYETKYNALRFLAKI